MAKAKDPIGNGGIGPESESRISPYVDDAASARIKSEIERTRSEMDRTMNALGEQLHPRHLLDEFLDLFRGGEAGAQARCVARSAARQAFEKIREHPVPSALVGAGIAYLCLFEDRKNDDRDEELKALGLARQKTRGRETRKDSAIMSDPKSDFCDYSGMPDSENIGDESTSGLLERATDKLSTAAESMKNTASSAAHGIHSAAGAVGHAAQKVGQVAAATSDTVTHFAGRAGEKARQVSHAVQTGAAEAGHAVRAKAIDMSHQVRRGYDYTRQRAGEVSEDYPLVVGAALMGLGVLVGLAMPRTRPEDELVGEKSDLIKRRARVTGKEMINRGIQVAQTAAEQTIDEAKRQGLTPSTLMDKARQVAAEVKEAARNIAEREELTTNSLGEKIKAVADQAKDTVRQELDQEESLQRTHV